MVPVYDTLNEVNVPMNRPHYCYWSVADGPYGAMMENCVRTARQAGVFKEFHVLTDRQLNGCECYDAFSCDKARGLFKLHYLKVGMSRLPFEYFIWLDADTVFTRNPLDVLAPLRKSPFHVPLESNLSLMGEVKWHGLSCSTLRKLYSDAGLSAFYACHSAFWIVHREAIDQVYNLAFEFSNTAEKLRVQLDVSALLGYAMQLLCGDPESHRRDVHSALWGEGASPRSTDENSLTTDRNSDPLAVSHLPAIVHVPLAKLKTRPAPVFPGYGSPPARNDLVPCAPSPSTVI
jgi:hypothetical protein